MIFNQVCVVEADEAKETDFSVHALTVWRGGDMAFALSKNQEVNYGNQSR
jgi:hypothetical protein